MSKPDSIPQDVRSAAAAAASDARVAMFELDASAAKLWGSPGVIETMNDHFACAIMAAKAEERRELQTAVQDLVVPADTPNSWQLGYRQCRIDAASAIRKRGEG